MKVHNPTKAEWKGLTRRPIEPCKADSLGIRYKELIDTPHKRYDFLRTYDNWIVCVTDIMENGAYSICGKWILSRKKCEVGKWRVMNWDVTRKRFNNALRIYVNSLLITGDWDTSFKMAYGRKPKSEKEAIDKFNYGVEELMNVKLEEVLDKYGITDDFIIERMKQIAQGLSTDGVPDARITGSNMIQSVISLGKIKDTIHNDLGDPRMLQPKDNRLLDQMKQNEGREHEETDTIPAGYGDDEDSKGRNDGDNNNKKAA